nr:MMPL family transporter [Chloroflexota bacterium]
MFSRWGRFVYRYRRIIAIITVALAAVSMPLATQVSGELSSGGWLDRDSESARVAQRLDEEFSVGRSSLIALYRGEAAGTDATSADFQARIADNLAQLDDDERVAGFVGFAETGDRRFISTAGNAAYVVIQLEVTEEESVEQLEELEAAFVEVPGLSVQLTGYGPLTRDATEQSEQDLQRAEAVSLPLALLILVAVFASLLAAGLPLLVAGLAIPSTLGIVFLVAQQTEMSIYVLNVATMLGLALAIDYSLFLVSRFREELARGRTVEQSVERAVATSGKAVVFSGLAVAIGLSGLLFFKTSALSSIGIGGSIVVLSSVFYALTFLPATLGMLGHRINSLSLAGLGRAIRRRLGWSAVPVSAVHATGRWERVARGVMAHPVAVLVPVLGFL